MNCVAVRHQPALLLLLETSGTATCNLSRSMLVSDNTRSLKMMYDLNLSKSHSIPAGKTETRTIV